MKQSVPNQSKASNWDWGLGLTLKYHHRICPKSPSECVWIGSVSVSLVDTRHWIHTESEESKTCFHEFVWPFFRTPPPPPHVSQWQDRRGANVVTPEMWAQRTEESKGGLGGSVRCGLRPTSGSEIWVREIRDLVWSETEDTEDIRAAHGDTLGGSVITDKSCKAVSRSDQDWQGSVIFTNTSQQLYEN